MTDKYARDVEQQKTNEPDTEYFKQLPWSLKVWKIQIYQ